jgi:hypothetical protein
MSTQLQYGLKSILSSFFDNNIYNLSVKLDTIDSHGKTRYLGNSTWQIRINRDEALDPEYSRIWMASTYIHEAFHAKLRQYAFATFGVSAVENWPDSIDDLTLKELSDYVEYYAKQGNIWEGIVHEWMVNHIDQMENSIHEFVQTHYPYVYSQVGAGSNAYRALAFMGLSGTVLYQEKIISQGLQEQYTTLQGLLTLYGANGCPQ